MFKSSSKRSLPSPYKSGRVPSTEQRQAACTHLNVTRLFDPLGCHKCQMCGRASSFGWLYRCTQDYDGFLPESDFSSLPQEIYHCRRNEQTNTTDLSQSVLNGIKDGHYTAPQIRVLQAQKLRVSEIIAMEEEGFDNHTDSSQTSSSISSSYSTLENSVIVDAEIPDALKHQSPNNWHHGVTKLVFGDLGAHRVTPSESDKVYTERFVPACHFKCCHSCRPAYRDRAFQSLDAILIESFKQPPQWELENRPISNTKVLSKIAASTPPTRQPRSYHRYDDSRDLATPPMPGNLADLEADSEDNSTQKKARRWSGFRETVRKALDAIDQSKSIAKSSKHSSKSSSRGSFRNMPQSMLFKRRTKQTDKENQIASNKALQESLALMLAINTPLPRASEDSDSLDGGEVIVEDGIAVTEEGVEMSTADIIMQA